MDFLEHAWPFTDSVDGVFTQKAGADKNRLRILGLIARRRCLSQRQLAITTGLQPSTVSNIVRALKTQGIIREGAAIEAERAGPKETELELVPETVYCAGVTLDPLGHRIVLVNACGHVLAQDRLPPGTTIANLVPAITQHIQDCAKSAGLDPARLGGLGVSVPGVVNAARGTVLISRSLGLHRMPLREPFEKTLGCPVWIERNVDCGAYAEHHIGAARQRDSFIYFYLRGDPGHPLIFGLSLVVGERIFHGCNSAAGEVDKNLLSDAAVSAYLPRADGDHDTDAFYEALAHTLAGIVNLLDIGCVILGSNDDRLTTERFTLLGEKISANLIPVPDRRFDLLRSGMGIDGIILGSALLALHRSLASRLGQNTPDAPRAKKTAKK
jgi:predicted NBD/HSP70 family sugar kinase